MKRALFVLLLSSCASFENEDIVIDTRVLAMAATVPDQVIDVDLEDPQSEVELLAQLVPTRMCALVADPGDERRLRWSMTLCVLNNDERCAGGASYPQMKLVSGFAEDPETTLDDAAIEMCADIPADGNLLGIIRAAFQGDPYGGLAGIDYGVSLVVGGETMDPALDLFAGKTLRVSPRIPMTRTANSNPDVERIEISIDGAEPVPLVLGRCIEQTAPIEVAPGVQVRLTPIESETTREVYVLPTLDGQSQAFTEATTYQWVAGAGSFSAGMTGGGRDFAGNLEPVFTDWRAPKAKPGDAPLDVPFWIVQRDERLGSTWYESCLRVVP